MKFLHFILGSLIGEHCVDTSLGNQFLSVAPMFFLSIF